MIGRIEPGRDLASSTRRLGQGFAIIPDVVSPAEIEHPASGLGAVPSSVSARCSRAAYAIRNLLDLPAITALARAPAIRDLVEPVLGRTAFPVRGLFFDDGASQLEGAWHQNRTVAVEPADMQWHETMPAEGGLSAPPTASDPPPAPGRDAWRTR
jgi:hypothetical protein